MGKKLFIICLHNSAGKILLYNILVASTKGLADAVAAAQTAAGVTTDPLSTQTILQNGFNGTATVDIEVT